MLDFELGANDNVCVVDLPMFVVETVLMFGADISVVTVEPVMVGIVEE